MYDWNALWHEHQGYRTGFGISHDDVNQLAESLSARLIKPAEHTHDVAVYDAGDRFILAGHNDGLQIMEIQKHELFDITVHFVGEGERDDCPGPHIEVLVDNLATGESSRWLSPVHLDDEGRPAVGTHALEDGVLPAMPFDELSFTDSARFRDALRQAWSEAVPALTADIAHWFTQAASAGAEAPIVVDARTHEMLERYAEIIRREQMLLSRRFADAELHLLAEVIRGIHFDSADSCRGLWLAVEARMLADEIDQRHGVDGEALLEKMKALSYTQEVALIEALTPPEHAGEADDEA